MTRIKICGITNPADAALAVEAGADALGVIAVPESPRYTGPEEVADIRRAAGPFVPVVIVVRQVADALNYPAELIQFYEGPPPPLARQGVRVFRIKDGTSLPALAEYRESVGALLLDTYHESALGGVGKSFDWSLALAAKGLQPQLPLILAGGLGPENVADAVTQVRPYAVDVASGVEATPGRKDPARVRDFIAAVRAAA